MTQHLPTIITTLGVIAVGLLTYVTTTRSTRLSRMARLERRLDVLEYRNRRLWSYARELVDHIYRRLPPPPPPWPDDLDDDDNQT